MNPADWLAWANQRCIRPELEWFYDKNGNMHLGYKAEWSRANSREIERRNEDERARYARNQQRIDREAA